MAFLTPFIRIIPTYSQLINTGYHSEVVGQTVRFFRRWHEGSTGFSLYISSIKKPKPKEIGFT